MTDQGEDLEVEAMDEDTELEVLAECHTEGMLVDLVTAALALAWKEGTHGH